VNDNDKMRDTVMRKLLKLCDGGPSSTPEKVYHKALKLGETEDYAAFLSREQRRLFNDNFVHSIFKN
jgi:hypothetical protein